MKKFLYLVSILCCCLAFFTASCTRQPVPPEETQTPAQQTGSPEVTQTTTGTPIASPTASALPAPAATGSVSPAAGTNSEAAAFLKTGQAALGLMKYEEALTAFGKAVEADKTSAEALAYRAETYWFLKMFTEASQDVENALKLKPDSAHALTVRGNINYSQEKFEAALTDFDSALKADPKNNAAELGKAKALTELGKCKEALEIIEKEKAAMTDTLPAIIQEAAIKKKMKDYAGAIEIYNQILKKNPEGVAFLSEIAQCLALQNKPEEAIKYYEQAEAKLKEINSKNKFAMPGVSSKDMMIDIERNKIIVYSDLGQFDKVVTESEKLMKDDGNNPAVIHGYAFSLYRLGKEKEAAAQMKNWMKIKPNPVTAEQYIDLADAYLVLKDYANAEKAYLEAEKKDSANANIYSKLGILYIQTKENKKAKANLEKALSMGDLGKADADFVKKTLSTIK
ncbi:MAG: tetratricopeptide repeat protein [Firmicutes bacterium]|nr:tetratricopeptide repeat protein [Bacillota bacterium]